MKSFAKIWSLALLIKIALGIILPLSNDEAYYWVWGHHPHLSYFDHPPLVGWLFWLGLKVDFWGQASRIPGILLGHCTLLIWFQILRPYLTTERLNFWLVFVLFSPFLGVGSVIITPDTPLLFFWSLSLLYLTRALNTRSLRDYLLLGLFLGLGFCSKYHIVLFVPITLIWLYASGRWREVKWPYVPFTILIGLLFCAPVLIWNAQNEWASFVFQINHGFEPHKPSALFPVEYVISQLLLIFPVVLYYFWQKREPFQLSYLRYFTWLPLLFFLYSSFKARVEANWTLVAYPSLYTLALFGAQNLKWLKVTIALWIMGLGVVLSQIFYPWIPVNPKKLKTHELTKYLPLADFAAKNPNCYASSYQMAASLSYHLRKHVYKLGGMNRRDFYDFESNSYPKADKFWVFVEPEQRLPDWLEKEGYYRVSKVNITDELGIVEVQRRAQDTGR